MTALMLLAVLVVGGLLLLSLTSDRINSRDIANPAMERLSKIFLAISPLPLVLTLLVPLAINLLTNFKGAGNSVRLISAAGCCSAWPSSFREAV